MSSSEITIARVYTLEGHNNLNKVLDILRKEEEIRGVTIIRGIVGYGDSGEIHTSSLLNLSLELPLIIEFYDQPDKVIQAIDKLKARLDLKHIVSWSATNHIESTL